MKQRNTQGSFQELEAAELFCLKCRQSVPVRKKLLLALPDGDKYDYLCIYCGSPVGTKTVTDRETPRLII